MKCDILCLNMNYHSVLPELQPRLEEFSFSTFFLSACHALKVSAVVVVFLHPGFSKVSILNSVFGCGVQHELLSTEICQLIFCFLFLFRVIFASALCCVMMSKVSLKFPCLLIFFIILHGAVGEEKKYVSRSGKSKRLTKSQRSLAPARAMGVNIAVPI